jgi:hypothetical protein
MFPIESYAGQQHLLQGLSYIPDAPGDGEASRAFAYGYIRALIQAAENTG